VEMAEAKRKEEQANAVAEKAKDGKETAEAEVSFWICLAPWIQHCSMHCRCSMGVGLFYRCRIRVCPVAARDQIA